MKLISALGIAALMLGCESNSTEEGAGSAPVAQTSAAPQSTTASTTETTTEEVAAAPPAGSAPSGKFDLRFDQTHMPCASCGIWFTSATLEVQHQGGVDRFHQNGNLLIKKAGNRQGRFTANLQSKQIGAIYKATLYMDLHTHEGIAARDNSSTIRVSDASGRFVKEITAARDIKGKGYSKSNPRVPFDFTQYAQSL